MGVQAVDLFADESPKLAKLGVLGLMRGDDRLDLGTLAGPAAARRTAQRRTAQRRTGRGRGIVEILSVQWEPGPSWPWPATRDLSGSAVRGKGVCRARGFSPADPEYI